VETAVLIVATILIGLGLSMICWRELSAGGARRKVGRVRNLIEVLLPIVAAVALVVWVWVEGELVPHVITK
jgi:hypothetical protein